MNTSTLEQMMVPIEEQVYNGADYVDVVAPSDILVARYQCVETLLPAVNNGTITAEQAMTIYEEGCRREIESAMQKATAAAAVVRARLKEIMPRQAGPWSWQEVIRKSFLPRNMPGVAVDVLGEHVLQPGDQAVEYDGGEDTFRILGVDGKVRTFPYEKLKTFQPSAFSGAKGIARWEEGFKRRRETDEEGQ